MALDNFVHSNFLTESLQRVSSLDFLQLNSCILINKLIDWKVAATNSDLYATFLNSDIDSLATKLVDTLFFAHEHDFEPVSIRVVIDKLCNLLINWVILHRHVDCHTSFQVYNVIL